MSEEPRWYEVDPMGHRWKRLPNGTVDRFVHEFDMHNGPGCTKCGFDFCHWCVQPGEIEWCSEEAELENHSPTTLQIDSGGE